MWQYHNENKSAGGGGWGGEGDYERSSKYTSPYPIVTLFFIGTLMLIYLLMVETLLSTFLR